MHAWDNGSVHSSCEALLVYNVIFLLPQAPCYWFSVVLRERGAVCSADEG